MIAFEPIDTQLAHTLARLVGGVDDDVLLAVQLASAAVRLGHVALDLRNAAEVVARLTDRPVSLPSPDRLREALARSPLAAPNAPLVLEDDRLYLRRYHEHEVTLAAAIRARVAPHGATPKRAWLDDQCRMLFPTPDDEHMRAARLALERRLLVVSGGPGTGKTWTAVRLVALAIAEALARGRPLDVRMLAPTGKAAARLRESVVSALDSLRFDPEVKAAIARVEPRTIHRALGTFPGSVVRARHDAHTPLPADVVLVDEASMVDVSLFRRLLDALRPDARVVLLGDPDQLASVEAGAILGDLVASAPADAPVIRLRVPHRFSGPIGALAEAIRAGDADRALAVLRGGGPIDWREDTRDLVDLATSELAPMLDALKVETTTTSLDRFRVLAAHRHGPHGVGPLNQRLLQALAREERIVLVTENDYDLGLFNGDVGFVEGGNASFPTPEGVRTLHESALPPHEPAFAMTVHKAQGSEVRHVAVVLPDVGSPLLGRELLYTAVTRARERVTLFASEAAVRAAIERRFVRVSGLGRKVWTAP